jgi:hypothetical protein
MGTRRRVLAAVACVSLGSLSIAAAYADTVTNNLDGTVDAVAESMPLNAGGPNGTTQLAVRPTNGDGKNGCNLTGGTTLTVTVNSSDTSVATVSPSSITFASCGDTPMLTVIPHNQGTATVGLTLTSNTTAGSFDLSAALFTVTVAPPPNTAPQIAVTGVSLNASYAKGAVPQALCQVIDAEDGNSSFSATLSGVSGQYAVDGIGAQTASCSYTDAGGLTAAASVTYFIVDPTPPAVTYALTPAAPDGDNGWYRSDVDLTWVVSEPESPNSLQTAGCVNQHLTTDQTEQSYNCTATSAGGGPVTVTAAVKRDATAPTGVTFVGGPADGGVYFPNSVPAPGSCTATDATSGLAGCAVTGYSTVLGSHQLTATATDNAGNTGTGTASYLVRKLDLTGFFQPVDLGGVWNTVKNGSTVPLKFRVFDRGVEQTSTTVVKSFTQSKVTCATGTEDTIEEIASTGGTSLRYDGTGQQFIQNWKTPTGAGTCYRVTLTLIDDTTQTALFKLK